MNCLDCHIKHCPIVNKDNCHIKRMLVHTRRLENIGNTLNRHIVNVVRIGTN